MATVFTIGHSNHPIENFIRLLRMHSVSVVCDVRSQPFSRANPQFSQGDLKNTLQGAGIRYVFLGRELGGRSDDRSCYLNGQVQYELLARTESFNHGIHRLKDGSKRFCIALMCAEKDPLDCHRTILVARKLHEDGLPIAHILANGSAEPHEVALNRLISRFLSVQNDFFQANVATAADAYARQAKEIAYRVQTAPVT